ncbi:MAG: hypothetical protein HFG27_10075 [Provencibacterium sp.]|jgi:putative aldouronate transport system substrate-binding protein|nr:hypothetical protein [Provencibacterium sp.]
MKLNKILAVTLAATMGASALAGCGGGGAASSSAPASSGAPASSAAGDASSAAPAGDAAGGDNKLVIALQGNTYITDYDDNTLTHLLEEKSGAELEFYMLPNDGTETKTKISLMVTSKDDLPDIFITWGAISAETMVDYANKGVLLNIKDYVMDPEKMPNFNAIPDEDRNEMITSITCADGNIYGLPRFEPEAWNFTPYRMYINGAWLKAVGKEVPTTTDELKDCLIAFRDGDPNGNGVKDEIGIYGYAAGGYGNNTMWALINSFTFFNGFGQNTGLALSEDGNTVYAPYTTDDFKEGLLYLNDLFKEGLIDPATFTNDDTQWKAMLNNTPNVVGFTSAGSNSQAWPDNDNNANFQEMDLIAPLKGPKGVAYSPYNAYSPTQDFSITTNCKNVDLAIKFGDIFYEYDVSESMRFGEKGVDWTDDPSQFGDIINGSVYLGQYDSITLLQLNEIWAVNTNKHWHNVGPRYASFDMGNTVGNAANPWSPDKKSGMVGPLNAKYNFDAHPEKILPALKYTAEETTEIAETITNVTDYVKQSVAEFVTGARSVEKEWDSYLKEMDNMGLQTLIQTSQTAYDRLK